jgi:hypothetical protein
VGRSTRPHALQAPSAAHHALPVSGQGNKGQTPSGSEAGPVLCRLRYLPGAFEALLAEVHEFDQVVTPRKDVVIRRRAGGPHKLHQASENSKRWKQGEGAGIGANNSGGAYPHSRYPRAGVRSWPSRVACWRVGRQFCMARGAHLSAWRVVCWSNWRPLLLPWSLLGAERRKWHALTVRRIRTASRAFKIIQKVSRPRTTRQLNCLPQ